jgi:TolB-like protein/class 3 adenylate cyclase/Tfp pilus assembly protein PilF
MADEGFKRKLAAILSADVVGYSRLMDDNEEATIQTLNTYRNSISILIQQHRGRVVDTTGDNLMAEFSSVVDAVKCAVETQKEMSERNADLPENRRMLFRIGVNLGDIVEEEDRIYGNGVNIAARLEGLAEAGCICISRTTYDQVKNKLELGYEYLGEHSVKNISEPVHVYRVLMEPEAVGKVIGEKRKEKRWMALAAVIVLLIGVGGLAGWYLYIEQAKRIEPASVEEMTFPLPEKPSIAVLPFDNISGDSEQDYIADGFTENIITGLSQIPEMFVIARNSVFTYKGKPVKIKQVSEELGVKYVLEGSIQKAGDRLRVNAQLIDALEGHHLWAERYDRELNDLFKLQDEITIKILKALRMKLVVGGEGDWVRTDSFEAWNYSVKGLSYSDRMTREDRQKARDHFEQALKLDPDYALAWMLLAFTHVSDVLSGFSESPRDSIKRALEIEQKTSESWPASFRHGFMNMIYYMQGQLEKAIAEGEKAVSLAPNSPRNNIFLALALNAGARPEEAIVYAKNAMRLEPYYPAWFLGDVLAVSYDQAGRYEEGPAIGEKLLKRALEGEYPLKKAYRRLALCYARLDRMEEARAYAAEFRKIDPNFSVKKWRRSRKLSLFKDQKWLDSGAEMMHKAGLPE